MRQAVRSLGCVPRWGHGAGAPLGHRQSEDLDWFTPETLAPDELLGDVEGLGFAVRGADVPAVQRILRHADRRLTTETYGHVVPDYLRSQIDRLSFRLVPWSEAPGASNDSQPVAT